MKYICVLLTCVSAVKHTGRPVSTKNGLVIGVQSESDTFESFLGIPYAEIDLDNPFRDSQNVEPFDGVYQATDDSAICPQQDDDNTIVGTLDCLRINVYVPKETSSQNLLPVMVFIHGGDFRKWNSNRDTYGPQFLVTKGVILVTFNYRLGIYGFMSIHRSDISGNAGLRDQLKALQWVRDNIAAFGGDENNITLFGEGAGAASVAFHMLSEYSKSLFHKAILQSGTILCDWVMVEPDIKAPIKLAEHLGLITDDMDDALHHLSTFNPREVIRATLELGYAESFKPSVESKFKNVKAMVKDKPINLLKEELYSFNEASFFKPVIIGFNSREEHRLVHNYLQSPVNYFEAANKNFKAKIREYFDFNEDVLDEAESLVRYFYIGDENISSDTANEMLEFNTDFSFIYPILRATRYYLQADNAPVYLYIFDYAGQRNYMKNTLSLGQEPGAIHGDEIGYLFEQSYNTQTNSKDIKIIHRMTRLWTDFAKTGNPTPTAVYRFQFEWHASKCEPLSFALLNDKFRMVRHPFHDRMAFWDGFFNIYEENLRW